MKGYSRSEGEMKVTFEKEDPRIDFGDLELGDCFLVRDKLGLKVTIEIAYILKMPGLGAWRITARC